MATHRPSPLQDRLLANAPDPIKTSILRESGLGWTTSTGSMTSSSSSSSITSPLRIAKRDSPAVKRGADIARRSSSSFKHVKNNNLVSKSPFKSQPPAPPMSLRPATVMFPTRRVSGEKRPRPPSMNEEAENENERPFALKRDRKQSRTFQGLLEKEPVTKSPFKQKDRVSSLDEVFQLPPTSQTSLPSHPIPISSVASHLTPVDSNSPSRGPSPGRSSLVSRRLHGPRLSGSGQRERRKTVTFDERCDVVEFDRATFEDEDFSTDDEERYGPPYHKDEDERDPFFQSQPNMEETTAAEQQPQDVIMDNISYDGTQLTEVDQSSTNERLLDPDTSITGLVEEMFFSSHAALANADSLGSSTPPRVSDIPTDLETEDGIPFGRTHHLQRLLQHRQQHSPQLNQSPPHFSPRESPQISQPHSQRQSPRTSSAPLPYPFNLGLPMYASPHGPPATPPRRPSMDQSTPPLGRSTHMERILKAREEEKEEAQMTGQDADKLPVSPSPVKQGNAYTPPGEGLIPKLNWPEEPPIIGKISHSPGPDPFEDRSGYIDSIHERSYEEAHTSSSESLDPANLSIGNSEVSLNNLDRSDIYRSDDELPAESVLDNSSFPKDDLHQEHPPTTNTPRDDEELLAPLEENTRNHLSPKLPSRDPSPAIRTTSPFLAATRSRSQTLSPRPTRISKEDIQRRLTEKRNTVTPSPEPISRVTESIMTQIGASYSKEDIEMEEEPEPQGPEAPVDMEEHEDARDGVSFMTAMTDISTEPASPECTEKQTMMDYVPPAQERDSKELGLLEPNSNLQVNFGSKFSLGGFGLSRGDGSTRSKHSLGVLKESKRDSTASMKVGDVDVQMDMKSALDRLMDDVAGAGGREEDSIMTEDYDESFEHSDRLARPQGLQRAATDTVIHQVSEAPSRQTSGSSTSSLPPPLPPKDNNIKAREQLILEKRREARRMGEGNFVPTRAPKQQDQQNLGLGRPSRRRSLSAGDVHEISKRHTEGILGMENLTEDPLSDSIERELRKLGDNSATRKNKYHVREHEETIYASSSVDKISHMAGPGDVDTGKAWRAVRRPSDMNEYSKQIKEYRNQTNPAKAYGKVFVRVLGIKDVHLPVPKQPTALTCTLNNGIHFVTTPECPLSLDCRIDQEFELIEHSKLEFTLTLKIRRDPHIIAQFKELTPAPTPLPPPPPVQQPTSRGATSRGGVRAFFSGSPKKPSKEKAPPPPPPPPQPQPVHRLPENLARYLKPDGTLARAFIQFKDIAARCDTRLFETSYPLIGQRVEPGGKFSTLQIGEIVLQMFRLPPLHSMPPDQLPQSLDECHRGLRHLNWHKMTYFQGTLTQSGGDCNTWRRRHFRVIGANLVAFNDVTKKATATIDLKKALAVHDDQELKNPHSPFARSRKYDDDLMYGVERSFRLIFPQDQEILFFADTDEEKIRWLEVFRALVGHIPPHPFWAELLWQQQEELSRKAA